MNVFDFDGTVYDGDSSVDFWFFQIRKNPCLLRFFPRQLFGGFLFFMKKITKEEFKSRYFSFIEGIADVDSAVKAFWNQNEHKIKNWYKNQQKEDDCVISASPNFLLKEICCRLGIKNLIATDVNKKTGKLLGMNCHDKNKPVFFSECFKNVAIESFYTDSKSDAPMARLAKRSFLVKKETITEFDTHENLFSKITKVYLFIFAVLMLIYCCIWQPTPIEEWDDYMMPTVTLASNNTKPHLAIFESDIIAAAKTYPQWKDYMGKMKFSSLKAKNGGELPWYFPTYSIACIPLRIILPILSIPAIYTFALTNLFVFLLMAFYAFFVMKKMECSLKCLLFIILLTFNPIIFYFEWISAEVFIYSMLSFGMLFLIQGKWTRAIIFSSLAATLNPTILVVVLGFFLFSLKKQKNFSIKNIIAALIAFVPFAYTYYNTGYINLSLGAGFGDFRFFPRFLSYLFDLNYGFLSYFPIVFSAAIIALPMGAYKKDWMFVYLMAIFLTTTIAYSLMDHINCGMSGIARYNAWNYVTLIFAICQSKTLDKCLNLILSSNFVILILIIFSYNPVLSKNADNLHFSPIASFFLDNFPSIYNPIHSTFYSRTAHVYGGYNYSCPVIYLDKNGNVRKILMTSNDLYFVKERIAAKDEKTMLFLEKQFGNLELKEQYVSVPKKYKCAFVSTVEEYTR